MQQPPNRPNMFRWVLARISGCPYNRKFTWIVVCDFFVTTFRSWNIRIMVRGHWIVHKMLGCKCETVVHPDTYAFTRYPFYVSRLIVVCYHCHEWYLLTCHCSEAEWNEGLGFMQDMGGCSPYITICQFFLVTSQTPAQPNGGILTLDDFI